MRASGISPGGRLPRQSTRSRRLRFPQNRDFAPVNPKAQESAVLTSRQGREVTMQLGVATAKATNIVLIDDQGQRTENSTAVISLPDHAYGARTGPRRPGPVGPAQTAGNGFARKQDVQFRFIGHCVFVSDFHRFTIPSRLSLNVPGQESRAKRLCIGHDICIVKLGYDTMDFTADTFSSTIRPGGCRTRRY